MPTWHRVYVPPVNAEISRLRGTETSILGEDKIDASLAAADLGALLEGV